MAYRLVSTAAVDGANFEFIASSLCTAVALANKTVRTGFAMLAEETEYRAELVAFRSLFVTSAYAV